MIKDKNGEWVQQGQGRLEYPEGHELQNYEG
jgi:hypothetical protein